MIPHVYLLDIKDIKFRTHEISTSFMINNYHKVNGNVKSITDEQHIIS